MHINDFGLFGITFRGREPGKRLLVFVPDPAASVCAER